jgi:DNA-binding transcriptional ArsR family regulator
MPVPSGLPLRDHRLNGDIDIATPAALIGDEARAAMLLALGGGRPLTASALARQARIGLPTASRHLARLVEGGLLVVERRGRSRYYRPAGDAVVSVVEALGALARVRPGRTLSEHSKLARLRAARTCYDHLAGRLGVEVFDALVRLEAVRELDGWARPARRTRAGLGPVALGPAAAEVFGGFGVDVAGLAGGRRPLASACLDWTETRPHLAGALGAALCAALFERGWLARQSGGGRGWAVTDAGRRGLALSLGVSL